MGTVPVSFRIDEDDKARLQKEAAQEDRSESYIANAAIKQYLDQREYKRKIIDQAIEDADKGSFISQAAMHTWVESWGSDKDAALPEPDIQMDK